MQITISFMWSIYWNIRLQQSHDDVLWRRFVLDVRNNGGGLFPAGVDVARMWLDSGEIVLIADSQGVRDSYEADGGALDATSPLSVLVNRGTASASEVRRSFLYLAWC